ncbi:unnamed protein product [Durusdinium trenchii]|uniref:EF-hand domain-containing protein n=1 Tax=Durusdinium trenchii TaxID=1381693 RepID=A0ABP0LBR3_9DINO
MMTVLVHFVFSQLLSLVLGSSGGPADDVPCSMASISRRKSGKRQLLCLQWNSVLGFFLRLWNFVAVGISLGSLLVILRVWQQVQRLEEKLELLNGDVKIALSELEEVRREMAAFNEKIKITTKDVEEEEGEDQSTAVEPTAMSRALTVRTRPALLGRGVVDACFDVATTGLALECHSMSASHCQRGASAEAIRAMCPKSCNVSDCRGAASCRDLDFTTFQEEDGSMSSCSQLRPNCKDWASGERVRRICPLTCGVCPGAPLLMPSRSEEAYFTLLANRTRALEQELSRVSVCRDDSRTAKPWQIPKILHQTWKTDQIPVKYRSEISSWRRLHPHWRFEFWDDMRSAELMRDVFPQYAPAFEVMSGIKRADVARIAALYAYGGVYADIDVEATRCFDPLLQAAQNAHVAVLLGEENIVHTVLLEKRLSGHLVSNAVMASAPGHPFWRGVLSEIFQRSCGHDPVQCTGPRLVDRVSKQHLSCSSGCVARLPFDYFSPQLARWNVASMTKSCSELFGEPAKLLPNHRKALHFACTSLDAALRDDAALYTESTFAVHRVGNVAGAERSAMKRSTPLRDFGSASRVLHSRRTDFEELLTGRSRSSRTLDNRLDKVTHGKKRKGHPLHDFREKLLKKWPTIQDAFSAIDSYLSKVTKPMNLQEWATTLSNLGLASQADGRVIYELLDENKDGDLTLEEFHWGIETVAPVLCMETLRKRLLCLGFPSMTMALSAMHGPGQDLTMLPLSLERFAECLCRAWIIQPEEHKAIFEAIRNPNEPSNTVTLSELLCGLAGVSPPLVLEDLATALRPRGRLAALKDALGVSDEQEEVSAEHWRRTLGKLFHFNDVETSKLLPMMDVDGIDGISMEELQSVLVFAEPSMFVEGSRKKVQQGYRSIESALQNIINESDLRDDSKFGKEELELLLESVEGVEMWEMAPVVSFVSGSSGIGVSISGFLKGLRLFAPCCVLEALRMQLITKGMSAFKQVPNHRMPLDREAFAASLKQAEIKLSEEETLAIFDLLDVRSSDVVTISELVALLQCSRPKGRPWRAPTELKQQVAFNVHQDIAPIQSGLQELKQGIRVALKEAKEVELEAQGLRFTKIGRCFAALPFAHFLDLPGSLCFIATVLACACGLWNYSRNIYKYWAYEGQSSYSDLAASDRATSFLDAGKLAFRDDVIVDFEHATGYREGTELLCVAPLVSKAATQGTVEFWAAGRRCCEDGDFNCGDAKRGAKAGLVFLEDALFSDNGVELFRAAAKAAEAQHGLRGSDDALFVFLTASPSQVQHHYWSHGVMFMVCASLVYFPVCVLLGFALHCLPRSKMKLEMRRY